MIWKIEQVLIKKKRAKDYVLIILTHCMQKQKINYSEKIV
jgi:DNA-binding protein